MANKSLETYTAPAEADLLIDQQCFDLAVQHTPVVVQKGLDGLGPTHQHIFLGVHGDMQRDDVKTMSDDDIVLRSNNPNHICTVTAHHYGYYFTEAGNVSEQQKRMGALEAQLVLAQSKNLPVGRQREIIKATAEELEPHVQMALRDALFRKIEATVGRDVDVHTRRELFDKLPDIHPAIVDPQTGRSYAVQLAQQVLNLRRKLGRKPRGFAPIELKNLDVAFDLIGARDDLVQREKHAMVNTAYNVDISQPASLANRLFQRATGKPRSADIERVTELYGGGLSKYINGGEEEIDVSAYVPFPTKPQELVGRVTELEIDTDKLLKAAKAGAAGGIAATIFLGSQQSAAAAPERAPAVVNLQVGNAKTGIDLVSASSLVEVSASVRAGEKCDAPFTYDDNMQKAVDKLIARGGNWKNQGLVLDFFLEKCVGIKASAGIVGNTQAESGTNPTRHQVNGTAYGAYQHDGEREKRLMALPDYWKLSTQNELAWKEMKSYKMVDNMQRAKSPEDAAVVFEKLFERAGVKRLGIRKSEARETYNEFMKEYRAILAEHGVDSDSQSGRTTAKAVPKVHLAPKKSFDIVSILNGTTSSTPAETASNTNTIVSAVLAEQPDITLTPKPAIKPHELESVRQTLDVLLGVDTASASAASPEASGTDPMLPSTAEKNDDKAAHGAAHDHLSALVLQDVLAKPTESFPPSTGAAPADAPAAPSSVAPGIVLGDPSPSQSNEMAPDTASPQPGQSQGLDASSIVSSPDTTSTQPASATPIALTIPDQQAKPITLDAAPVTQEDKPVVLDVAPATDNQPITLTANGATATPIPETAPADKAPTAPVAEQPDAKAPETKKAEAPKPKQEDHKTVTSTKKHETVNGDKVPEVWKGNIYYSQYDKRWASAKYSAEGDGGTIAASGCGATSLAIVVANLADKSVTPVDIANYNMRHGYKAPHNGTSWAALTAVPKAFGLKAHRIHESVAEIKKVTDAGGYVIINGTDNDPKTPATRGGHIYVIRDVTPEGRLLVLDPAHFDKTMQSWDPKTQVFDASTIAVAVTK